MAGWYVRLMSSDPGIGAGASAPWYRVVAIPDVCYGGTAERDYASVLPAVLDAAHNRRPFVTGWFSRGGGAPLELLTNAGPLPSVPEPGRARQEGEHPYGPPGDSVTRLAGRRDRSERCELLFPWGARGVPCAGRLMADLDRLVWAPCPGRHATPLPGDLGGWRGQSWTAGSGQAGNSPGGGAGGSGAPWLAAGAGLASAAPTLFEAALTTLMGRPFGWLVVAEPTELVDAEIAELRGHLNAVRRFDEERSRFEAERAARPPRRA